VNASCLPPKARSILRKSCLNVIEMFFAIKYQRTLDTRFILLVRKVGLCGGVRRIARKSSEAFIWKNMLEILLSE
jgi:hypothetical protein